MIELKEKNYQKDYEPYDKILREQCVFIVKETGIGVLAKPPFRPNERYLCPCGMVKVSKGPGYKIQIESDACGFK